jgi:hypothetical protein
MCVLKSMCLLKCIEDHVVCIKERVVRIKDHVVFIKALRSMLCVFNCIKGHVVCIKLYCGPCCVYQSVLKTMLRVV